MLSIANANGESITINGNPYPFVSTQYHKTLSGNAEIDTNVYAYVPKTGKTIMVTVGNTTTTYVYSNGSFIPLSDFGFNIYATDKSNKLIYGTDFDYDSSTKVLSIKSEKGITIQNIDPSKVISSSIYVENGVSANITLAGINLNSDSSSPIKIADNSKGNVKIILAEGTNNTVTAGGDNAAVSKNSDSADCGTLTITCEHTSDPNHKCGKLVASTSSGAAIGGDKGESTENITIKNAVIYASTSSGAAVIGGGNSGKGSKIYIDDSVAALYQNGSGGYDTIGNGTGSQSTAADIYITNSSVSLNTQTSPVMNRNQKAVYPLTISNTGNAEVTVDGIKAVANNNSAADSGDTKLYLWLEADDHSIEIGTEVKNFHFNPERLTDSSVTAFKPCEADISGGYLHDDTAHWYACTGSTACKANGYGEHDGAATCAEKAKCTVCGAEYGSTLNHEMELIEAVEPTCIDDGNREYYHCKTCGKYFSDANGTGASELKEFIIQAKGHSMTKHDALAPICSVEGNKEYYVCDTCGKLYTDEHGNDETTLADVALAATGKHIFGEWTEITPADCTNDGSRKHTCKQCNTTETEPVAKLGHDFSTVWTTDKPADCTTAGVKSHHCVRCDAVTDETEIPATGHTFGNWTVITPADCTHDGVKAHTCTLCNKTETEPIEKLGHNFSTEWTIDIPAGCTTKGIKTHHCIVCDEKADETIIPAAGHKFGRWKVVVEPTTEQKGLQRRTCTVCDTVEEETLPKIPAVVIASGGNNRNNDLPLINGEARQWDSICSDIIGTTINGTLTITVNDNRVPENIIRALAEKKATCSFVVGSSISIIVNGSDVTNTADGIAITSASGHISDLRGNLAAKIGINADFPFEVKISRGTFEKDKFVNLYQDIGGKKMLVGTAPIGADNTAVIPVSSGGEFIAMTCEFSDILGDADNDGVMNAKDAAHMLRYSVGLCELGNSERADFNHDGTVDANDAAAILRSIVGL